MSDMYEARNSIYCYKGTNILKNYFDIHDQDMLEEIERKLVIVKLYDLRQNGKIGSFDINHFIGIHRYLFEDIYPFAGLFRTENIGKGSFTFAEWQYIENELERILLELEKEQKLIGLEKRELASRLSYYMAELNVLHPFRDGNGRVIREFIRELAYECGYILDIQHISPTEMLDACIESVLNTEHLEKILEKCLKKKNEI